MKSSIDLKKKTNSLQINVSLCTTLFLFKFKMFKFNCVLTESLCKGLPPAVKDTKLAKVTSNRYVYQCNEGYVSPEPENDRTSWCESGNRKWTTPYFKCLSGIKLIYIMTIQDILIVFFCR